ncbi:MAG: exodeoxyribonuclease VII large subunit [Elusimicrobiota bacterium]
MTGTTAETPAERAKVLSVTRLNELIHDALESSFADVWVEGEISDPRAYPSGHTYFTLKDPESQVSAVLFRGSAAALRFKPEHGLQVLARGRVSTYMKRGQYQLIVTQMQPKAAGALQLAFEQLKRRLAAEGLFDESRKKPLPPVPERVGIVTSLQGAAIRDMLSVIERRFKGLHIRIHPVQVQGDAAAPMIARAVDDFNRNFPDTDVLLVGRGGGSLEDLWAFNEESVARAIAASRIPVVSCVGHETDFTIADFVADLRAPTPSAAAELVVPDREAVLRQIGTLAQRLIPALAGTLGRLGERLASLTRSPFLRDPRRIFEQKAQRIDELSGRLVPGLRDLSRRLAERLARAAGSPSLADPARLYAAKADRMAQALRRLAPALERAIAHAEKDLRRLADQLDALSPLRVLSRGYAIVFKKDKKTVIRSVSEVNTFDTIDIRLHDGEFEAQVR